MSLKLLKYSEQSFVLVGDDTKRIKDDLVNLGGKWNPNLNLDGKPIKGWIFSSKKVDSVRQLLGDKNISFIDNKTTISIDDLKKVIRDKCFYLYSDQDDILNTISTFCTMLESYNPRDGNKESLIQLIENFKNLPNYIQCVFENITNNLDINNYKDDVQFRLKKLIFLIHKIEKEREKITFEEESKVPKTKKKITFEDEESKKVKRTRTTSKKKYDKEGQTRPEVDENDPLFLFYSSLYNERPESVMATTWLTQHGCFEGEEREELYEKYKNL